MTVGIAMFYGLCAVYVFTDCHKMFRGAFDVMLAISLLGFVYCTQFLTAAATTQSGLSYKFDPAAPSHPNSTMPNPLKSCTKKKQVVSHSMGLVRSGALHYR